MRSISWILCLMMLLAPSLAPAARTVLVKAQSLTMREKPSKSGKSIDKIVAFQPVELLKTEGDWAQVKTATNQTGYVLADYLTPSAFVYTGDDKVNARQGPGTQYDTWFEYNQPNFPLRVLDATESGWLMVMDYDGDRSWVYSKGVHASGRYVITREPNTNARKGVGIGQDMVFKAPKGFILKVLEEKDGWLRVKCADGDEGWLSAKVVFGWLDVDAPGAGKSAASDSASSKPSAKKKSSSGDSDDEDAAANGKASSKKKSSGGSTRRTKRSSGSDDDGEASSASKPATRSSAGKSGSVRSVSLRSGARDSESGSESTPKTSSRRTRARKAASPSGE